uniref:Ovule protein n=1 Tax=Strongyloides venezuelensis TaxID=75913 RepID=A0A0K0EWB2_STRVS
MKLSLENIPSSSVRRGFAMPKGSITHLNNLNNISLKDFDLSGIYHKYLVQLSCTFMIYLNSPSDTTGHNKSSDNESIEYSA